MAAAHTFFVGEDGWLVHNQDAPLPQISPHHGIPYSIEQSGDWITINFTDPGNFSNIGHANFNTSNGQLSVSLRISNPAGRIASKHVHGYQLLQDAYYIANQSDVGVQSFMVDLDSQTHSDLYDAYIDARHAGFSPEDAMNRGVGCSAIAERTLYDATIGWSWQSTEKH